MGQHMDISALANILFLVCSCRVFSLKILGQQSRMWLRHKFGLYNNILLTQEVPSAAFQYLL
jgi:hypothetical protein